MPREIQLELGLSIAADVTVTRFADGEIRMKPKAPLVEGGTKEAAKVLGISPKTVLRMLEEGTIKGWKPAKRKWRINMISVYAHKQRSQSAK